MTRFLYLHISKNGIISLLIHWSAGTCRILQYTATWSHLKTAAGFKKEMFCQRTLRDSDVCLHKLCLVSQRFFVALFPVRFFSLTSALARDRLSAPTRCDDPPVLPSLCSMNWHNVLAWKFTLTLWWIDCDQAKNGHGCLFLIGQEGSDLAFGKILLTDAEFSSKALLEGIFN